MPFDVRKYGAKTQKRNPVIFSDVDGTIIFWQNEDGTYTAPTPKYAQEHNLDPKVNDRAVQFLRNRHAAGATIVLWSMGGEEHCRWAAKFCGIDNIVSNYLRKPTASMDDKPGWKARYSYNEFGELVK